MHGLRLGWILSAGVCCAGFAAAQDAPQLDRSAYGFKLSVPAGWRSAEQADPSARTLELKLAPADGSLQLKLTAAPAEPGVTPATLTAYLRKLAKAQGMTEAPATRVRVGEHDAELVTLSGVGKDGVNYRLLGCFVVASGRRYGLELTGQSANAARDLATFRSVSASFRLAATPAKAAADQAQLAAARLNTLLTWAPTWEAASERATEQGKLILVYAQAYPSFDVGDLFTAVVLADPEVTALIQTRFVPLRLQVATPTPLHDPARYGLSKSTFGRALLVVDARGTVLRETERLHPVHLDDFLGAALRAHATDPAPIAVEDPLVNARDHLARGELREALASLAENDSCEAHLLRARALRRQRQAEPALAALHAARAAADAEAFTDALELEGALLAVRRGEGLPALTTWNRLAKSARSSETSAQAAFYLGCLALVSQGPAAATGVWTTLLDRLPDSPWAWRAGARLLNPAMSHSRLDWPAEDLLATSRHVDPEPLPLTKLGAARAGAVAFLLERQRPDGSWPGPSELNAARVNPFTVAYTAVAARALLGDNPRRHSKAVERAHRFLSESFDPKEAVNDPGYMDHSVWAHAYSARFFADCLRADIQPSASRNALSQLVTRLLTLQRPSGGWSYLLRTEARQADDVSISFVTAAVLHALLDARELGLELPVVQLDKGLDCLGRLHQENGTYAYLGSRAAAQPSLPPGGAGRGPVCAHALLRGGRVKAERVREALAIYLEFSKGLWKERGKALMHTGPHAQGSHYLLFDLSTTAEAVAALPKPQRARYRKPLLRALLSVRTAEGAFLDTPILGPCVGTGFAIDVLRLLD